MTSLNFEKLNGLIPAVIQNAATGTVLMVGFMNRESLEITKKTGLATFYSRTRHQLWTKGETSGRYLRVKEIIPDCDGDTLLVKALPDGPVCHTGSATCFGEENGSPLSFLAYLQEVIAARKADSPDESYTAKLLSKGPKLIAKRWVKKRWRLRWKPKAAPTNAYWTNPLTLSTTSRCCWPPAA